MKEKFFVESKNIDNSKKGQELRKLRVSKILEGIEGDERRPFKEGDLVYTNQGQYADIALEVKEIKPDGMVKLKFDPKSEDTIEIFKDNLWHFDDAKDAYAIALIKEQKSKFNQN